VINCEANPIEYPDLRTDEDLIDKVTRDENTIVLKEAFMNSMFLPPQRVRSDPATFSLIICNLSGHTRPVETTAAADGYWIFLEPLPQGKYNLRFSGACEMGRLKTSVEYKIIVE
jgi:hypothetical protein